VKLMCLAGRLALLLVSAIAWAQEASTAPAAPPAAATNAGIPATAPSLGEFREGSYRNDYFGFAYPMGDEWIRETTLMRRQLTPSGDSTHSPFVLLAGLRVPRSGGGLVADAQFILLALGHPPDSPGNVPERLAAIAVSLRARDKTKQMGEITRFDAAGLTFYRADFQTPEGRLESYVCAPAKDYLLEWDFIAASRSAMEGAISTLRELTKFEAPPPVQPVPGRPLRVRVAQGVSQGLNLRKVPPKYPDDARAARIQGTVLLRAIISKTGDVVDLEAIGGPRELVPSAVNAVRQWKYKPYLLAGNPVEVETQISVIYQLNLS
jgi:TonB family protein